MAQGITSPVELKNYYDVGADLGGPVARDRLWFYTAFARQQRTVYPLGFTTRDLSKTRGNDGKFYMFDDVATSQAVRVRTATVKMTWQASLNNRFIFVMQPTAKQEPQRGGSRTRSLASTLDYLNPGWTNKFGWQSTITPKMLLDVNIGGSGYFANYSTNRTPWGKAGNPSISDVTTGYVFGQGTGADQDQNDRRSASASLSLFPDRGLPGLPWLPGKHEVKVGFDYNHDRNGEGAEDNAKELGFAGNYTITTDSCQVSSTNPNVWQFTINTDNRTGDTDLRHRPDRDRPTLRHEADQLSVRRGRKFPRPLTIRMRSF